MIDNRHDKENDAAHRGACYSGLVLGGSPCASLYGLNPPQPGICRDTPPQMVQLKGKDFALSPGWRLELARGGSQDDIAVEGLKEGLASRFHLALASGAGRGHQGGVIPIETSPGSVKIGDATDRNRASLGGQAYRLDLGPEAINRFLKSAGEAAARHDSARAVAALDAALDVVEELRAERNASLRDATDTWYKTWYPRVLEANGRRFLHELDDVQDG